jgi:hypothetical protein
MKSQIHVILVYSDMFDRFVKQRVLFSSEQKYLNLSGLHIRDDRLE